MTGVLVPAPVWMEEVGHLWIRGIYHMTIAVGSSQMTQGSGNAPQAFALKSTP